VLTYKIAGDPDNTSATPGARIYISSNAYGEYQQIDTDGAWKTYTFFVEGNAAKATSLSINLALGNASTYNKKNGLTTGYAFFDNLAVEEIEIADYQSAVASEESDEEYRASNQTFTCKVTNGRFDFGSTTVSSAAAPSGWSVVLGNNSESDVAPSGSYINGVVNVADFETHFSSYPTYYIEDTEGISPYNPKSELGEDMQNIVKTFGDNRIGTKVAMLSQRTMTAQGLKASNAITIEKGKSYAITVSVYTFDVRGAGVTLELAGDGYPIYIKGISENKSDEESKNGLYVYDASVDGTNGVWTTYTFYIEGNQYKNSEYKPTFWLGTGGTNDNTKVTYKYYSSTTSTGSDSTTYAANGTFASGWAFFDEVKVAEISSSDFADALGGAAAQMMKDADKHGLSVTGADAIKVSLTTENLFDGVLSYDMSAYADASHSFDDGTLGTPDGFAFCEEDVDDETLPVINAQAGVVSISDSADFSQYGVANPGIP
ncbi:MAG: hypothetical protein MJ193_03880, partial [Clostridia bacterium]|nr:hypothetical protein [Clostridia bacterium]